MNYLHKLARTVIVMHLLKEKPQLHALMIMSSRKQFDVDVSCCRGLFLLQGNAPRRFFYIHVAGVPWSFFTIMTCVCTTCEALYTTVRMAPQAAGFCRSGRIDLLLEQKYELLQSNSRLLGCERVMETRAEFHCSWVYTFSATLSSLRNWANNDTEQTTLRPSTPTQLCWSSSRLQPLQLAWAVKG